MRAFVRVVFLILLIVLIGAGALYLRANPGVWQDTLVTAGLVAPASGALRASGFVEARGVDVAAEVSGRIVALAVDEGDRVTDVQTCSFSVQIGGAFVVCSISWYDAAMIDLDALRKTQDTTHRVLALLKQPPRPREILHVPAYELMAA